tara:strand:+ start:16663 stop:18195 length:1533 start_codon:yes stop_codon:yes gene_type:complete
MQAMVSPALRAAPSPVAGNIALPQQDIVDREQYEDFDANPVRRVSDEPVSTFSVDVDTASYSVMRRYLNDGTMPPVDSVRIEELINYFDYTYPVPESTDPPFSTNVTLVPSPWADNNYLMQVGLQGYEIPVDERPPINLTLLVDVSGSMNAPDKLPLAKQALGMLIDQMTEQDTISIVVYAGAAGTVLEPTSGDDKAAIMAALDRLSAGGSTAGGEGLRLAYSLAEQNFDEDSVNRVMMLTDGDFNVGITSNERLEDFVARQRDSGIYLSVMGFGRGNYNDHMMQTISQAGNGTAGYIDTLNEARKLLSDDLSGSLFTIAEDVKIQVEFNPDRVSEYRLIGYETRMLNEADFNNDAVDAGEIGAGHTVTAIYEITPAGETGLLNPRRYENDEPAGESTSDEWAFVQLRYKPPQADESILVSLPVTDSLVFEDIDDAPLYTRFATSVAAFGQLLRGDPYMLNGFGYEDVIELALDARGRDEFGYRSEFVQLVRAAQVAADQAALQTPGRGE